MIQQRPGSAWLKPPFLLRPACKVIPSTAVLPIGADRNHLIRSARRLGIGRPAWIGEKAVKGFQDKGTELAFGALDLPEKMLPQKSGKERLGKTCSIGRRVSPPPCILIHRLPVGATQVFKCRGGARRGGFLGNQHHRPLGWRKPLICHPGSKLRFAIIRHET